MIQRLRQITSIATRHWRFICLASCGFVCCYYAVLLVVMMSKFQQIPNYFTLYDWPGNVSRIIQSTPSMSDSLMIIKAEWLLEIGYLNYDFGMGIAEWSLYLSPAKTLALWWLGVMLALLYLLARHQRQACESSTKKTTLAAGGVGATLVSFSLMSLSWVVCCATPTWIVGLAILGLGVSTSLWLEPIGPWLNAGGFALLSCALLAMVRLPDELEAGDYIFKEVKT